jgi:hypothetical protein
MKQSKRRLFVLGSLLLSLALFATVNSAEAQERYGATPRQGTKAAGQTLALTATLVNPEHNAKARAATVQVTIAGVDMVDPAAVNEEPKAGQGHLHYQVDNGPVVATTATKLSFHDLSSGQHTIVVMLAGNDHSPLGPKATVNVGIP